MDHSAESQSSATKLKTDVPKTVIEHLDDLRDIIIKISIICFLGWIVSFYSAPHILKILNRTPV